MIKDVSIFLWSFLFYKIADGFLAHFNKFMSVTLPFFEELESTIILLFVDWQNNSLDVVA